MLKRSYVSKSTQLLTVRCPVEGWLCSESDCLTPEHRSLMRDFFHEITETSKRKGIANRVIIPFSNKSETCGIKGDC
jgi:hypothetical protein